MPDTEIKSICNANMSTNRFNYMNAAKEIVRRDRDGVFDYASAARDLEWDDDIQVDAFRTLEILADTVRTLDVFDLVDDANKSAATWRGDSRPTKRPMKTLKKSSSYVLKALSS